MIKDLMWNFIFSKRANSFVRTMSIISVVAVSLSLAALIVITAVMGGFSNTMLKKMVNAEPDLVIPIEGVSEDKIKAELLELDVRKYRVSSLHDVIIKTLDGSFGGALAKGLSQEGIEDFLSGMGGVEYSQSLGKLRQNEVILGEDLARSLGVLVGEEILIIPPDALIRSSVDQLVYDRVVVRQTFTTQVQNSDRNLIIFPLNENILTSKKSASYHRQVEVELGDPYQAEAVKESLLARKIFSETWGNRNGALILALKLEKIAMSTFLGLGALITSFSITSVLVLLINQKKRNWGIFMSMGLSPKKTRELFVRIGLLLSGVGLGAGLLLGFLSVLIIKVGKFKVLPEEIYYDPTLPAEISLVSISTIVFFTICVAFLASWGPAFAYSKLDPIQSIKS